MKIKALCAALAMLMLFIPLVACQKMDVSEEGSSNNGNVAVTTAPNGPQEEEYVIDAVDYGGKDFIILASTVSEEGGRHFSEYGGSLEKDKLNQAIYYRDQEIMEKYKINIKINTTVNWNTELNNSMMSDDLLFHIATPGVSNAVYSLTQSSVACLDDFPMFDFSRPWWQTGAMKQMEVLGKNYFAMGDINMLAYDSVPVVFYNKEVAKINKFTELHAHVKDGSWDYAKFMEYVAKVTANTNGDDEFGAGDTFGYAASNYSALCFTYAGNWCFVEKDADGIPTFKEDQSQFITFWQKLVTDHHNPQLIGYGLTEDENMFQEDRLLFSVNMLGMTADYRTQDIEYGILPLPKWTTSQDTYYTFPHQSASTTICIPRANREYDMTSRIVEDMAYRTHKNVLNYYIEENLFLKSLDGDKDSYEALQTVLSNLNCDIFFSYRAGITDFLRGNMDNFDINIASKFQKYKSSIGKQLSGIVAGVMEESAA